MAAGRSYLTVQAAICDVQAGLELFTDRLLLWTVIPCGRHYTEEGACKPIVDGVQ